MESVRKLKQGFSNGGSIDIHNNILPLLPKIGLTIPGYNYCGPGNLLEIGKPFNKLNAICERHN